MRRFPAVAACAAITLLSSIHPAACATARAADPFEEVVLPGVRRPSYVGAYLTMAAGAGFVGASFLLRDRANQRYDEYLVATDPDEISRLFDETRRLDRFSSASLIGGEVLVAVGIYLRFIRHPVSDRVSIQLTPSRCALSLRF